MSTATAKPHHRVKDFPTTAKVKSPRATVSTESGLPSDAVIRVQLELAEGRIRMIDNLMEVTGLRTRKDLFEQAIIFLGWAVDRVRQKNSIVALDAERGVFRDVLLPALENAKLYEQKDSTLIEQPPATP